MRKAARNLELSRIYSKKHGRSMERSIRLQLCYRCLAQGHQGKSCPQSRPCGQDGCIGLHHRLRHKQGSIEQKPLSLDNTELKRIGDDDMNKPFKDRNTCLTEGKEQTEQTTMVTQSHVRADFIRLRTVQVIFTNGGRSLKINALLDDLSTRTYVNPDVAAELGLKVRTEKVTVSVLNGQAETFDTKPVSVELKSVTGSLSMIVNAYMVNRVTGNMLSIGTSTRNSGLVTALGCMAGCPTNKVHLVSKHT